jgi:alpha-glucosidase
MLSDSPTAYQKEDACLQFISGIPVVWDTTVPLESVIGDYVSVARRKGTSWYLGSMSNWQSRKIEIALDFLDQGKTYEAEIFADGVNADRIGNDYQVIRKIVKKGDVITAEMAPGGGYAARFTLYNK